MKKETLVKLIDEEFGDDKDHSWLIEVLQKAFIKNDSKITEATEEYWNRSDYVINTLGIMIIKLKESEKSEIKNGVRITHKRKGVVNNETE